MKLSYNSRAALYLIRSFADYLFVPRWFYRWRRSFPARLNEGQRREVSERAAYYCRLSKAVKPDAGDGERALSRYTGEVPVSETTVGNYRFPYRRKHRFGYYFFDLYHVVKYFGKDKRFRYKHGDVWTLPSEPAFVKSRPIGEDNGNAVLLRLNRHRHFRFVDDKLPFRSKLDRLVCRTNWGNSRPQRRLFFEKFWNHPLCDVGKTHAEPDEDFPESIKGRLTIEQQLRYKFIACIEGNDVATSLKWVMSSNSVAVSPPMKYETWFMEGLLVPDYHFICVKPDYSDLEEKLRYYMAHPDEAEAILDHAREWVARFRDEHVERAVGLAVAQKYFEETE